MKTGLCISVVFLFAASSCYKKHTNDSICEMTGNFTGTYTGIKTVVDTANQIDTSYAETIVVSDLSYNNSCRLSFSSFSPMMYIYPTGSMKPTNNNDAFKYSGYFVGDSLFLMYCNATVNTSCNGTASFKGKKQ